MPPLSDKMLANGCVAHIETVHGEPIAILSGPDAGKPGFIGVVEIETDLVLDTEQGADPRGKRMLRFKNNRVPQTENKPIRVKTSDGREWQATSQDFGSYLTTDFELVEKTAFDS